MEDIYLSWIKAYCKNDFIVDGVEDIPEVVEYVVEQLIAYHKETGNKKSESLGDYSVSYASDEAIPARLKAMLKPYCKGGVYFL